MDMQAQTDDQAAIARLEAALAAQRAAYLADPVPSADQRRGHLKALMAMMLANRSRIHAALEQDYGRHPAPLSDLVEIAAVIDRAEVAIAALDDWMRPEPRSLVGFGDSTAVMTYQPKGVIGMLSPWNFPFELTCGPLVDMLAAGDRVIIKPSELAPACADLLAEMIGATFAADHVTTAVGGVALAEAFARQKWDHLMFTGSTAVGRRVMQAAAENLTALTLELGGKCPVVVLDGGLSEAAIEAVVGLKLVKSGQVCVTADHMLVPRADLDRAVAMLKSYASKATSAYSKSADCTGVISERHAERLRGLVADARASDAAVHTVEADEGRGKMMPLHIVVDPGSDSALMREEIFGPILPVIPHDGVDDVIARINAGGRPLAIYLFGGDQAEIDRLVSHTVSGGVTVNGAAHHVACGMGFGGSGASGFGRHHGVEGFREFSNLRAIFTVSPDAPSRLPVLPPYDASAVAAGNAFFEKYGDINQTRA